MRPRTRTASTTHDQLMMLMEGVRDSKRERNDDGKEAEVEEVLVEARSLTPATMASLTTAIDAHRIRVVRVRNCAVGSDAAALALVLRCASLSEVDVAGNGLGDLGVASLFAHAASASPNVTTLSLANNGIGVAGAATLALALSRRRFPSLTTLDVSGNPLGAEGLAALAALTSNVVTLHASHTMCSDRGAEALSLSLSLATGSLKNLDLDDSLISDDGAIALARNACASLASLSLLGNDAISARGAEALGAALAKSTCLTELSVPGSCPLGPIAKGVAHSRTLRKLRHGGGARAHDVQGAVQLSLALTLTRSLRELDLSAATEWPSSLLDVLAAGLARSSLATLWLGANCRDSSSASLLRAASCSALVELRMRAEASSRARPSSALLVPVNQPRAKTALLALLGATPASGAPGPALFSQRDGDRALSRRVLAFALAMEDRVVVSVSSVSVTSMSSMSCSALSASAAAAAASSASASTTTSKTSAPLSPA